MKLIQINVWCGRVRNSTIEFIKEQDADVVCTQEIINTNKELPGLFDSYNIHNDISAMYPFCYFSPTFDYMHYGVKTMFGNAVYSKHPILDQKTVFVHGQYTTSRSVDSDSGTNVRNLQIIVLDTPQGKLTVANHHGYHTFNHLGDAVSVETMRNVATELSSIDSHLIFAGDLNTSYESDAIKVFENSPLRNLTEENNIKTTLSQLSRVPIDVPCDYIFVSKNVHVNEFTVSEKIVSDHKALILDFSL
jgi:endonuclease/exonuclease/phosphatase family metal-dependent hydrolase